FLRSNLKDPSQLSWLDKLLLQASAPIQFVAAQTAQSVSSWVQEYVYLVEVKRDNDRLAWEKDRLVAEGQRLHGYAEENRRLRSLLALRTQLSAPTLSAEVVAKEVSPFFRVVRIQLDRGADDGLRPGMAVVSAQGLVGQVRRSWGHYADVLLTVDRSSAIDVVIRRSGARGILRGSGDSDRYLARIQYLQRVDKVKVGDAVHTSGLGQRFPGGVLVGHVSDVKKRNYGLYQEANVAPAVNFSALQEVLVLLQGSKEQQVLATPLRKAAPSDG
ncbi:MAG: rod shape-determining protein MreC, partial [Polyangiales bacterium]